MIQERVILCGKCNKSVPIGDVKYVVKSSDGMPIAMCTSCRNSWESTTNKKKKPEEAVKELRKIFLCHNCGYKSRFNVLSSSRAKCPFCGRADRIEEYREDFAEKLVRSM